MPSEETATFTLDKPRQPEGADAVARCAAINQYRILDTPTEPVYEDITKLAAAVCEASFVAISFVCDERQWFKSEIGLGINETPISISFCAYAIQQPDIYEVRDARENMLFAKNPLVTGNPLLRFYAGMPILASDGTPIATLCVLDTKARPDGLTDVQRMTLRVLAKQVEAQLELRRSIIERDIRAKEQQSTTTALRWVANHDSLTRLGNRALFSSQLGSAIDDAKENGTGVAVVLVDIDHFKQINESLGHDAGDAVLRSFASRLREVVREGDTVARLGGDEFGVVLTEIKTKSHLAAIVESLNMRLREKLDFNGRLIECRASMGVAVYADHAVTAAALVKCSDLALGIAKNQRGSAVTFHPDMETDFEREMTMTSLARDAIAHNRVFPYYQPKIDLRTGELMGFEALLRWEQRCGALGTPVMIAPAFADSELALVIGEHMMTRVLDDIRRWCDAGIKFGQVAINTCPGDFAANDFAERLLAGLRTRGLSPSLVEVEVTESVFLDRGSHYVLRALTKLSERGVRISLDDFGTGFASLTHLKKFPVDVLKVDQSFVAGLGKSADDAAIVRALIGLGLSLGMDTVAEGVETHEQATFVRECGCTLGQGYLFGAAGPASDVPAVLTKMPPSDNVVPINLTRRGATFEREKF